MYHGHSQKSLIVFLMVDDNLMLQVISVTDEPAKEPVHLAMKTVTIILVFMQRETND